MKQKKQPHNATEKLLKTYPNLSNFIIEATNKIAESKNLDQALEKLVDITTEKVDAERGTIFINDPHTDELYSRVAQGNFKREIRILNTHGIAGWVYTNQENALIKDTAKDERFAKEIDEETGYTTKSILCTPFKTLTGDIIGVSQLLNKKKGVFSKKDLEIVEAVTEQAAIALQSHIIVEQMQTSRKQELEFLDVVSKVSSELNLSELLKKIIETITQMLDAERSTLFINDPKTNELYTEVGEGLGATRIRFPNHLGIAGTVFTTKEPINIPHAYADLRFNPSFDKKTGFFTRSVLCTPVKNKDGKMIGVTQVLNKKGGPFTHEDAARLSAFTSQIAIGIENATLFDDIQSVKNYNESMLESMSNGVLTINNEDIIKTCNKSGLKILKKRKREVINQVAKEFFIEKNQWLYDKIAQLKEDYQKKKEESDDLDEDERIVFETEFLDAVLQIEGEDISGNITIVPLEDPQEKYLGTLVIIEDISNEKRMKSTMSRYMSTELAEKLMKGGEELLGGQQNIGTVLFSDVRSFTTITETLGAQGTVSLLNEYFTLMVDCIQDEGGMLDKFIGDAMMAIFGVPFTHDDDPDRGVRAAIQMMVKLNEFNVIRKKAGQITIDHGMGLNTDKIVSGNIGSPKRMDYTVIGDGVNLAARLESACKKYGARILISEYTFAAVKATYRSRQVDKVIVKGKTKPVGVYEVLDYHTEESFPNMIEALGHFNSGFKTYQEGKFNTAIKSLKEALKANPEDKCSKMYIERCNQLKEKPPKDWKGVWVFDSK